MSIKIFLNSYVICKMFIMLYVRCKEGFSLSKYLNRHDLAEKVMEESGEILLKDYRDFPDDPMAKSPHSQCRGAWLGN